MVVVTILMGILLGTISSFISGYLLYRKRENDKATRLRSALLTELRQMDELSEDSIQDLQEGLAKSNVPGPNLQLINFYDDIYQSNTQELDRLHRDEINNLVEFYIMVSKFKSLTNLHAGNVVSLHGEESHEKSGFMLKMLTDISEKRRETINSLES